MLPKTTALLLLAAQQAWDDPYWGERNNPDAETHMAELLAAFRAAGLAVVQVRRSPRDPHSPLYPGEPGHAFRPATAPLPAEPVFTIPGHCAFTDTDLAAHLRAQGVDRLVLAGFTTSHGISSTARSACERGFRTVVVGDACVAFELDDVDGRRMPAEALHQASLAALQGEFAMVLPTAALLPLLGPPVPEP
jgi:nicotinamidase-related amidase